MTEQRRLALALALSAGILFAWERFYAQPRRVAQEATQQEQSAPPQGAGAKTKAEKNLSEANELKPKVVADVTRQVELQNAQVSVSNGMSLFTSWRASDFGGINAESVSLDTGGAIGEIAFDSQRFAYLQSVRGNLEVLGDGLEWTYQDAAVQLSRSYLPDTLGGYVDVTISAKFLGEQKPGYLFLSLLGSTRDEDVEAQDRKWIYWAEGGLKEEMRGEGLKLREVTGPVKWVSAASRYFLLSMVDRTQAEGAAKGLIQPLTAQKSRMSLVYPVTDGEVTTKIRMVLAPKKLEVLRSIDPTLEKAVDFGWLTVFAYPLLKVMKWFHAQAANWGIAIILLTLLVKLLTFPLTYKSMKSMKQMAAVQPEIQKLRDKYKDDKEALNREMISMMREKGYNPLAGCLPILVQMPVFFALYRVLYSAIELYGAPFYGWIHDLSAKDPYYVLPVLLTATMYFQQKLTPNTATDPVQQKMMQWMPVIFGVFMLTLPSGLSLYMLVNAVASIAQQLVLNRRFNVSHAVVVGTSAR